MCPIRPGSVWCMPETLDHLCYRPELLRMCWAVPVCACQCTVILTPMAQGLLLLTAATKLLCSAGIAVARMLPCALTPRANHSVHRRLQAVEKSSIGNQGAMCTVCIGTSTPTTHSPIEPTKRMHTPICAAMHRHVKAEVELHSMAAQLHMPCYSATCACAWCRTGMHTCLLLLPPGAHLGLC